MAEESNAMWTAEQASNATKREIDDYITSAIQTYAQERYKGSELFEFWKDDFVNFTAAIYKKSTVTTKQLREFLRTRNVYIPRNKQPIGQQFMVSVQNGWIPLPDDQKDELFQEQRPREAVAGVISSAATGFVGNPVATLTKLYTDDQKYDGSPDDSFDLKYHVFVDLCEIAKVPASSKEEAFKIMLKGTALLQYYMMNKPNVALPPLAVLRAQIKDTFEGVEYKQAMLAKWNSLSLQKAVDQDDNKDVDKALQNLIVDLRTTQAKLDIGLHDDAFLQAKLLSACRDHPACQIACSIPSATVTELVNKLRANVTTWKAQTKNQQQQFPTEQEEQWFTDRRYRGNSPWNKSSSSRSQSQLSFTPRTPSTPSYAPTRSPFSRKPKACFVCHREGCWSTKHTEKERKESRERFKSAYNRRNENDRHKDNSRYLSEQDLEEHLEQYIVELEGGQNDDTALEQLVDDFDAFFSTQGSESFCTEVGTIEALQASKLTQQLLSNSTAHALTAHVVDQETDETEALYTHSRYDDKVFHGILVDTGAAGYSTAGLGQFKAFQITFGIQTQLDRSQQVDVKFGIGNARSIGRTTVTTPIGDCSFHVVETATPFLLSLNDLDQKRVRFDNLTNCLLQGTAKIPVVRRFGHAFLQWGVMTTGTDVYLNETELRTLHRRFGHPSARRLTDLLKRSGHEDRGNREALEKIVNNCEKCQRYGAAPMRFKFTLHDDSIDFNHSIFVDIMYIAGKPVLHVVDEATRFQAAKWLPNMTSEAVWEALRSCWIDVYLGPPDILNHDAGTNLTSSEFRQYSQSVGIHLKEIPVEAASSMGIVERYHLPLRRAYAVIDEETGSTNKTTVLQMAVKALNDTAGPDGLVPTLLVFGAFPRIDSSDGPSPSIAVRAKAIQKAMAEVVKLRAKRQVATALTARNGPTTPDIPIGCQILVWRSHQRKWDGPFQLLALVNETATIMLPSGPTQFRSTVIKRYAPEATEEPQNAQNPQRPQEPHREPQNNEQEPSQSNNEEQPEKAPARPQRDRQMPARFRGADVVVLLTEPSSPDFTASRTKELNGLLQRGVFAFVIKDDVPTTTRLFNSRFVDALKLAGTPYAFEKSRLVVQAYNDAGKQEILTQAPTVQRASQRLLLALAVTKGLQIYSRDISQAYVQSKTTLSRDIFVRPPRELQLPDGMILKVMKPLYGIPEAGNHWYRTYHSYHLDKLKLKQSASDPCLLYKNGAIVALQTDDTLFACNNDYAEQEHNELKAAGFEAKDAVKLTSTLTFNGARIQLHEDGTITVSQDTQCQKISLVDAAASTSNAQYIAQRARGAYIASVCQPQATCALSQAAQTTSPTKGDMERLNKVLQWQMDHKDQGIRFVKLDETSLRLIVFTDASFANNQDLSSQVGFVIFLADKLESCNVLHWSSTKCKRVTRSVLAAELYAMAAGFDAASVLKHTINEITAQQIPLIICIDSYSLYECLVKIGTAREKRLMIDIAAIRQAYERREIAEVVWIEGTSNPADAMTKSAANNSLDVILRTNRLSLTFVSKESLPLSVLGPGT